MRLITAGESHGLQLTAILEGMPSGIQIDVESLNADLKRRQQGYGRGDRMKIEADTVEIVSGVRWGESLGSPITLIIKNRDWVNWSEKMSVDAAFRDDSSAVTRVRPGHADLAGAIKYNQKDARNILERSSARETAARVAVGAVAKLLLAEFGISIHGFVSSLGGIAAIRPRTATVQELVDIAAISELSTYDISVEVKMKQLIDHAKVSGDSVGGVVEILVSGAPVGLGSYVQWDRKLDARLAMALMSIQAIKGVEVGIGFAAAELSGSKVHDEISYDLSRSATSTQGGFYRSTNNAGGIEGGMSNGEEIVLRCAMKPIPTLYSPLKTVDMLTKQSIEATVERSDVCAVPAAAVVAEAVVAFEIANAFLEKFGGDSLAEVRRNYDSYLDYVRAF
jgi:chorismate synthase